MKRMLTLCLGVPVLIACGEKPKIKEDQAIVLPYSSDQRFAEPYFLADAACQTQGGAGDVGNPPVWLWNKDLQRVNLEANGFAQGASGVGLAGGAIKETTYNYHQVKTCRQSRTAKDCSGSINVVNDGQPLKVCAASREYPRISVEMVALSSMANLTGAQKFYNQIAGKKTIPAAQLLVLPKVETKTQAASGVSKSELITDNLAYASDFGGSPAFVIFPKGSRSSELGLWNGINLWEIPWALAHEFGHHIFQNHAALDAQDASLTAPLFYGNDSLVSGEFAGMDSTLLIAGSGRALGAVNEAFADLFAYYAQGARPLTAKGLDCFEKTRDVDSAVFFNGEEKILSDEALSAFELGEATKSAGCKQHSFADVHTMGAVVAHTMERIWVAKTDAPNLQQRSSMLLAWAEAIGRLGSAAPSALLRLAPLLESGLKLASEDGKVLNATQCALLRQYYPAFASYVQDGTWSLSCR